MGHEMRFRSLLIAMLLLIVFVGHSNATKPRKAGIGVRYGYINDETSFRGTANDDKNVYVDDAVGDAGINSVSIVKFPLFIQLDETLINNFTSSSFYLDIHKVEQNDHPPNLKNISFEELIDSKVQVVPSENTFTDEFSNIYPQYSSIIEDASNPSLSADYDFRTFSFGKSYSIFFPYDEKQRWATLGGGLGLYLLFGNYSINICDPYKIDLEKGKDLWIPTFREGFCLNKKQIFSSEIGTAYLNGKLFIKVYSYIDDKFEVNILSGELSAFVPDENYWNYSKNVIIPNIRFNNTDLFALIYTF